MEGRTIETVDGERIVQAWRVAGWAPGEYSLVRVELRPEARGTRLVLDHTGIRPEQREHLASGWNARDWEPLSRYLEGQAS
ncbi:MAG: SRPBCC domain-containing protein [Myxococcales bacterium]|nr:SRPBCC domain-containing protein [Myxococcales bacterium]